MICGRPPTGHRRVAWECGFSWGLVNALSDPAVAPDRDVVSLNLTVAEARAALALDPDVWWAHWSAGWVAALEVHHRRRGSDGG